MQARRKRGAGGALAPQFLAKQLTLSQPGGTDYAHHSIISPPRIFRPCDGPVVTEEYPINSLGRIGSAL